MGNYCRKLETDSQIELFVDGILCIEDEDEKRTAINLIAQAERNIKDYPLYPTLTHTDDRDFKFRDNSVRMKLRKQIIDELYTIARLDNDDEITLGRGGAVPRTGVKLEGKAFYVIGLPASGKSGVASKIADAYGCYVLDSDYAKRKLPEYTNQIGSATLVHEESDQLVFGDKGLITKCIGRKANVVIPKIGHNMDGVVTFCAGLKNAGYSVHLICVDLDRQKATQRAYKRYHATKRYVPLSLIFDAYGNQPTLNYFKIKQQCSDLFAGFAELSTDVPIEDPVKLIETHNIDGLDAIDWR